MRSTLRGATETIVHLSDLHFGAEYWNTHALGKLRDHLVEFLARLSQRPIIVLSGDITFKGSHEGYRVAADFFGHIVSDTGIDRNRFIVCPGNHDIARGQPFGPFDQFSYGLRRDKSCVFGSASAAIVAFDHLRLLILNSAYHADPGHGLIDLKEVENLLRRQPAMSTEIPQIAITHHHIIPTLRDDSSVTRNAYDLVRLLDGYGYRALLHGHQHYTTGLPIGHTPVTVFGVSSLNFQNPGITNGLNLYRLKGSRLAMERYALIIDTPIENDAGFIAVGTGWP
jgi:3',5'-cyclic AMP phosphodiesterase CpdA